VIAAVSSACS